MSMRIASGLALGLVLVATSACGDEPRVERLPRQAFAIRPVEATAAPPCEPEANVFTFDNGGTVECLQLGPVAVDAHGIAKARYEEPTPGTHTVVVTLTEDGLAAFNELTSKSVGKRVAIVANGRVQTAPTVQEPTFTGDVSITGASEAPMRALATLLERA
ncbi:MAG TPA: hypothetical protein VF230_04915 [Acidimicrobiales bacterium]